MVLFRLFYTNDVFSISSDDEDDLCLFFHVRDDYNQSWMGLSGNQKSSRLASSREGHYIVIYL